MRRAPGSRASGPRAADAMRPSTRASTGSSRGTRRPRCPRARRPSAHRGRRAEGRAAARRVRAPGRRRGAASQTHMTASKDASSNGQHLRVGLDGLQALRRSPREHVGERSRHDGLPALARAARPRSCRCRRRRRAAAVRGQRSSASAAPRAPNGLAVRVSSYGLRLVAVVRKEPAHRFRRRTAWHFVWPLDLKQTYGLRWRQWVLPLRLKQTTAECASRRFWWRSRARFFAAFLRCAFLCFLLSRPPALVLGLQRRDRRVPDEVEPLPVADDRVELPAVDLPQQVAGPRAERPRLLLERREPDGVADHDRAAGHAAVRVAHPALARPSARRARRSAGHRSRSRPSAARRGPARPPLTRRRSRPCGYATRACRSMTRTST